MVGRGKGRVRAGTTPRDGSGGEAGFEGVGDRVDCAEGRDYGPVGLRMRSVNAVDTRGRGAVEVGGEAVEGEVGLVDLFEFEMTSDVIPN